MNTDAAIIQERNGFSSCIPYCPACCHKDSYAISSKYSCSLGPDKMWQHEASPSWPGPSTSRPWPWRIRDEFVKQNEETTELTTKLDKEIHSLKAQLEAAKYDVTKYCIGTILSISAFGLAVLHIIM